MSLKNNPRGKTPVPKSCLTKFEIRISNRNRDDLTPTQTEKPTERQTTRQIEKQTQRLGCARTHTRIDIGMEIAQRRSVRRFEGGTKKDARLAFHFPSNGVYSRVYHRVCGEVNLSINREILTMSSVKTLNANAEVMGSQAVRVYLSI